MGTTLGVIRLNRHLHRFQETGDPALLDVLPPSLPSPGWICPDLEEYRHLFEECRTAIVDADEGRLEPDAE